MASIDWLRASEEGLEEVREEEGRVGSAEKTRATMRSTCQLRRFRATSDEELRDTSFTLLLDLGQSVRI